MKILVVDDVMYIRKVFSDRLTKLGHQVIEAEDGEMAIARVKSEQPDVVVLDIVMPKMDGITALKQIRSLVKGKIIMCSVMADRNKVLEALSAGADDYVIKPLDDTRFIEAIDKAVEAINK